MRQTETICWKAHNENSGASEQACGSAQDASHTEFVCSADHVNYWLEVK